MNQQICQIYRKSIDLFVFLQADNRTKHTHMHTKYWFYCSNQQNNLNLKNKQRRRKNKREKENQLRQCFGFYSRKFIYTSVKTEKNEKKRPNMRLLFYVCKRTTKLFKIKRRKQNKVFLFMKNKYPSIYVSDIGL